MSLRWSSYVAPKSRKGGSKTQNGRFPSKIALRLKKVSYEVSLCENCQPQSCKVFIILTIRAKLIGGDNPFYLKFWVKMTSLGRNCRFSIYFRSYSASAVTPSEKSSTDTNRKSTARFPMSPRWISYVVPKPPPLSQRGAQKSKVFKITISRLRAFDWYRARWPWMILNGVIALILRFSPNSIALHADYVTVTVVEYKPIMSVEYSLPVPVFHFRPKLIHPAARSFCNSW